MKPIIAPLLPPPPVVVNAINGNVPIALLDAVMSTDKGVFCAVVSVVADAALDVNGIALAVVASVDDSNVADDVTDTFADVVAGAHNGIRTGVHKHAAGHPNCNDRQLISALLKASHTTDGDQQSVNFVLTRTSNSAK
jgi:hypothetical protein